MDYGAMMQMAISIYGEQAAKNMDEAQLRLMVQQLKDIRGIKLPDLPELKAEELGQSNVGNMQSDQSLRSKQLQAIATLQNLIDQGGLDLTDQAALEDAMSQASNQQKRARAGVAADMQARGQANSGARLVMDMDAAQKGANDARRTGLETAAMAQRRRLEAIQRAGSMSGGLREQDWREGETSNRAKDIRDERNAAAREKAALYNAGLPQQQFHNALAKATGQLPSANAVGSALSQQAGDTRQLHSGLGSSMNQAYGSVTRNGGSTQPQSQSQTYEYNADLEGDRGGPADISRDDDEK